MCTDACPVCIEFTQKCVVFDRSQQLRYRIHPWVGVNACVHGRRRAYAHILTMKECMYTSFQQPQISEKREQGQNGSAWYLCFYEKKQNACIHISWAPGFVHTTWYTWVQMSCWGPHVHKAKSVADICVVDVQIYMGFPIFFIHTKIRGQYLWWCFKRAYACKIRGLRFICSFCRAKAAPKPKLILF